MMVVEHVQGHTTSKWQHWESNSEHARFANYIDRLTADSLGLILETTIEE